MSGSTSAPWMVYGANGYTGELICAEAARAGEKPILAGRREESIRPIAERHGFEYRIFALDDPERVAAECAKAGVKALLLAAGPFSVTSAPVVQACLSAGVHYLDITGEIPVFEACHARDAEAKARKIAIMPGVGFDVVPSDCLAAMLQRALPDSNRLELGFATDGGPSKGTALTALEGASAGGAIREQGKIKRVPHGYRTLEVPFRSFRRQAISVPWGDVSTAYYSTKIPDIIVYLGVGKTAARFAKVMGPASKLLGIPVVERLVKKRLARMPGPDAQQRETFRSHMWGRVTNARGESRAATMETPEAYKLTAIASVEAVRRLLAPGAAYAGALTPSMAFGANFVLELPNCPSDVVMD